MLGADWWNLLFSVSGRLRRSHFWVGMAMLLVAHVLLGGIPLVGVLFSLALVLPGASIGIRRLHDMGHTGWWALAPVAGAVVTSGVGLAFAVFSSDYALGGGLAALGAFVAAGPVLLAMGLVALLNLAFVLWVGLAPGVAGDNRFGPDPRQARIKGVSASGV